MKCIDANVNKSNNNIYLNLVYELDQYIVYINNLDLDNLYQMNADKNLYYSDDMTYGYSYDYNKLLYRLPVNNFIVYEMIYKVYIDKLTKIIFYDKEEYYKNKQICKPIENFNINLILSELK